MAGVYQCDTCYERFDKDYKLKDHRRNHHTKSELFYVKTLIETFKCEGCNKGHHTAEALRKHIPRCGQYFVINSKIQEDPPEFTDQEEESPERPKQGRAGKIWKEQASKSRERKTKELLARPMAKKLKHSVEGKKRQEK